MDEMSKDGDDKTDPEKFKNETQNILANILLRHDVDALNPKENSIFVSPIILSLNQVINLENKLCGMKI